ncbi:MAG: 3,4-dihydroxy-2-butanone-4-phosphate synthase [Bdellovibrionales bacterium]|nr:3,4-dihydroxy-2-butanone-4-phosphate synthase [Bdellovibrionales bacterium]
MFFPENTEILGMQLVEFKDFLKAYSSRGIAILEDDVGSLERSVLVSPAQTITPERVNELLTLSGGIVSVAIGPTRAHEFALRPMEAPRGAFRSRDFVSQLGTCTSVEAREDVGSGISTKDRSTTISILGEPKPNHRKLVSPGHIFPVQVREGGVLVRAALAEAALDITRSAGFTDAAAYLDYLGPNGEFLSSNDAKKSAKAYNIPIVRLSDVILYRLETETLVTRVADTVIPSRYGGELRSVVYKSNLYDGEHLALIKGEISPNEAVLTRVQQEFTFSDVFGGSAPPSRAVIQSCLKAIGESQSGVFVYLRRPESGHLSRQVDSSLAPQGPRPAAMMREYGLGAQILRDLGVRKINLLAGRQLKMVGLPTFGIEIVSLTPLPTTEREQEKVKLS